jgi:pyruvate/2-oxoacid:ferredoxin oxidoreductase alpha subunit
VLVAENNMGQLRSLLRDRCLVDAVGFCKVDGRPFAIHDVRKEIEKLLGERKS